MATRAVQATRNGVSGWLINGEKMWTTGMHVATHCALFARTSGDDGDARGITCFLCAFNYSKDKDIQALGDSLVAVAGTILEGARLETLLQHDRLGLDSEMEYVAEASKDGRLQEIGAIRGILDRLADDSEVIARVRRRARAH